MISSELFLTKKSQDQNNMPEIILKERTAQLASYTFLQEILINMKTRHFHNAINYQQHLFRRTLITSYFCPGTIAKFLKTYFCRTPPEAVACRCSSKQVFLNVSETS